jgi:hyperosmotically inducible periplasmic protein
MRYRLHESLHSRPVSAIRRLNFAALVSGCVFVFVAGCSSTPSNPPLNPAAAKSPPSDALKLDAPNVPVPDADIAARVKAALSAEPDLRALPVSVATYRGAVMLSGYVNSDAQIQKAVAISRGVPGVQSVNNDLLVRPQ